MTDKTLHGAADRATDSDAFEYTARAGFAISGVLHLLVGYLILRIAFGSGGNADQSGALATLAQQTGGTLLLWVVAAGLLALELWRVAEAIIGSKPGEGAGQYGDDTPVWSAENRSGWPSSTSRSRCRPPGSPWAAAGRAANRIPVSARR
jgi:Domain of Unknown Function (DUF1206)